MVILRVAMSWYELIDCCSMYYERRYDPEVCRPFSHKENVKKATLNRSTSQSLSSQLPTTYVDLFPPMRTMYISVSSEGAPNLWHYVLMGFFENFSLIDQAHVDIMIDMNE